MKAAVCQVPRISLLVAHKLEHSFQIRRLGSEPVNPDLGRQSLPGIQRPCLKKCPRQEIAQPVSAERGGPELGSPAPHGKVRCSRESAAPASHRGVGEGRAEDEQAPGAH